VSLPEWDCSWRHLPEFESVGESRRPGWKCPNIGFWGMLRYQDGRDDSSCALLALSFVTFGSIAFPPSGLNTLRLAYVGPYGFFPEIGILIELSSTPGFQIRTGFIVSALHIVEGGVENGDKRWLEKAARLKSRCSPNWAVPKSVHVGDEVVVFVRPYGFFATAKIASELKPREDWPNRYGAALTSVRLINPAISLAAIRGGGSGPDLGDLAPQRVTSPSSKVAEQVRALVAKRRKTGLPDLVDAALEAANIDELRKAALLRAG
jgi:hypothetical protein